MAASSGLRASGPPQSGGAPTSPQCRYCRDGWEHCHGTVIIHVQHRPECTDEDCLHPESIAHSLRIDCEALGCPCGRAAAVAV